MRPGMGSMIFGAVLLALGVGVTMFSGHVIWYGAILVGLYRLVRGATTLSRAPPA